MPYLFSGYRTRSGYSEGVGPQVCLTLPAGVMAIINCNVLFFCKI